MSKSLDRLFRLSISDISSWFTAAVFSNAGRIYRAGQVIVPKRYGTILTAEIRDQKYFYDVAIAITADSVRATCECQNEHFCEHIGALLLNWLHSPSDFKVADDSLMPDFLDYIDELVVELDERDILPPGSGGLIPGKTLPGQTSPRSLAEQLSQSMEQELRELLPEQTIKQLRAIARRRGWQLRGTRKKTLIDQLVQFYLEAQDTAAIVESMDAESRQVMEYMALRASAVPIPGNLAKKAIRRLKRRRTEKEASAILQELGEQGLLLVSRQQHGFESYRVPGAILHRLPPWPDLLSSFTGAPDSLEVRHSPSFALVQVAYRVWQYLGESSALKKARDLPKPTRLEKQWPALRGWPNPPDELAELDIRGSRAWQRRWQQGIGVRFLPPALTDADLAQLGQRTTATDDILDFAFNLLSALGLVHWDYGTDIQIDQSNMTAFLAYSDAARLRILTSAWMQMNWWTEMSLVLRHAEHIRVRRGLAQVYLSYDELVQELAQARMVVVALLRRLVPGQWYSAADFRQLLRRFWPDFLHTRSGTSTRAWWLETVDSDYRLAPDKSGDWQVGYAPFVTACLEGPLAWLGVVMLGYNRQGLAAFQITELGAYLLGLRQEFDAGAKETSGPPLDVHGDGTVIARTGHVATGAYDVLNAAAHLQETFVNKFHYRITTNSAQRAFEQGWTGQSILNALKEYSGNPVPEPLRGQILAWSEGYGQVHLYDQVSLVEFADDFALQELLASTSLAQHMIYQFSPRLVAIQADAIETFRDELVRLGHTPRVE